MLSTGFGCLKPTREISAREYLKLVLLLFFSRGTAATLTLLSGELAFPPAKWGSQHKQRPFMLLSAYTLLAALLALLLPRRSLSCVGQFAVDTFSRFMSD
jgi:hypothetical protein